METYISQSLAELAASLAALATKEAAYAVRTKVGALKNEKNLEKVRNAYDELISELLEERSEAILLAQAYKAKLDQVQISEKDIESLDATVERVLKAVSAMSGSSSQVEAFDQFRTLINADTLKTMQLLGFNYKAAIGEPLTEVCADKIRRWGAGKSSGSNAGGRDRGNVKK